MEVEFTRMSPNGQIVIPADIRKAAKFSAKDRFIVISEDDTIIIKKLTRADFAKDLALLGRIAEAEEQVRKGETITFPASMPIKEQMRRLDEYGHSLQRGVRKKKGKAR